MPLCNRNLNWKIKCYVTLVLCSLYAAFLLEDQPLYFVDILDQAIRQNTKIKIFFLPFLSLLEKLKKKIKFILFYTSLQ